MKTSEQFFGEITTNKVLAEKLTKVTNDAELEEFLTENGAEGTAEEFKKLIVAKAKASGELSDEQLEAVSGGVIDMDKIPFGQKCDFADFHCKLMDCSYLGIPQEGGIAFYRVVNPHDEEVILKPIMRPNSILTRETIAMSVYEMFDKSKNGWVFHDKGGTLL